MGYRPTIICKDVEIELGKFYGYSNLDGLKSIEWLKNHKPDIDVDIFNYAIYGPTISFTADEFRDFMDLYEKDINDYKFVNNLSYDKPFKLSDWNKKYKDIYDNDLDKIIEWG